MDDAVQQYFVQQGAVPASVVSLVSGGYIVAAPGGPSGQSISGNPGGVFGGYTVSGGRAMVSINGTAYTIEGLSGW